MKRILFVSGLALVAYSSGAGVMTSLRAEPTASEEAVAIKCTEVTHEPRTQCEDRYRRDFASGERDPLAYLRQHCTRWKNPWEESIEEPPATCVQQFGGWIES